MTSSNLGHVFERFVHETLGSLAAPEVREEVVRSALRMATPEETPDSRSGFEKFVRGPLRAAMLNTLGAEITDTVSAELEHLLLLSSRPSSAAPTEPEFVIPKQASVPQLGRSSASDPASSNFAVPLASSRRPRPQAAGVGRPWSETGDLPRSERPSSQAYARGTARALGAPIDPGDAQTPPRVLVASESLTFVKGLAHFLAPQARRVVDAMQLLQALNEAGMVRSVVVLDCRRPSIRPIALAALAEELPTHVQVMLWGASQALRQQLAQVSPAARFWVTCDEGDDLQAVAQRCEAIVGSA